MGINESIVLVEHLCISSLAEDLYGEKRFNTSQNIGSNAIFIGADGKAYKDISLVNFDFSARVYNALKNQSIYNLSQLLVKSHKELSSLRNVGKKGIEEMIKVKNATKLTVAFIPKKEMNYTEQICQTVISIIKEKIIVDERNLFIEILPKFYDFGMKEFEIFDRHNFLNDEAFLHNIHTILEIRNVLKRHIIDNLQKSFYGSELDAILLVMPKYLDDRIFITCLVNELLNDNIIELYAEKKYIIKHLSFEEGILAFMPGREYGVFMKRIKGQTPTEISEYYCIAQERVHFIETQSIGKLNRSNAIFKEDIYLELFKKFIFSKADFIYAFNENEQVYNYLRLRYKKRGKIPIKEALYDECIPSEFKVAIKKLEHRNYVLIDEEFVYCNRKSLCEYVIHRYGKEGITFKDFSQLYLSLLEKIGKKDDSK